MVQSSGWNHDSEAEEVMTLFCPFCGRLIDRQDTGVLVEGEKERIQMFTGTVIARRGSGLSETIALYRVSYGAGMERVFSSGSISGEGARDI